MDDGTYKTIGSCFCLFFFWGGTAFCIRFLDQITLVTCLKDLLEPNFEVPGSTNAAGMDFRRFLVDSGLPLGPTLGSISKFGGSE